MEQNELAEDGWTLRARRQLSWLHAWMDFVSAAMVRALRSWRRMAIVVSGMENYSMTKGPPEMVFLV